MTLLVSISQPVRRNSHALDKISQSFWNALLRWRRPVSRLATILLVLFLTLLWSTQSGQSQQTSNETGPQVISNPELRTVLGQLYELKALRIEVKELQDNRKAELEQMEKERALWKERVELEQKAYEIAKERLEVAQKENTLLTEQVTFYRTSYEVCVSNKKTSGWCKFKKIIFLGIPRCK